MAGGVQSLLEVSQGPIQGVIITLLQQPHQTGANQKERLVVGLLSTTARLDLGQSKRNTKDVVDIRRLVQVVSYRIVGIIAEGSLHRSCNLVQNTYSLLINADFKQLSGQRLICHESRPKLDKAGSTYSVTSPSR
ncbi:hypothetical protein BaRGS_00010435 [Batillaria attramentaria]|uniref:Uncharacterized protein n=1 Tax=Batillaria attramentaria TaxID=370345 RepID=A0ABD0LFP3_9CAEN